MTIVIVGAVEAVSVALVVDCTGVVLLSSGAIMDVTAIDAGELVSPATEDNSAGVGSIAPAASVDGASSAALLLAASEALSFPSAEASSAAMLVASLPAPTSRGALVNISWVNPSSALPLVGAGA